MNELQERIDSIINLEKAKYFYHLTSKNVKMVKRL